MSKSNVICILSVQRGVPPDSTSVEHGLCSGEGFGHNHHQGLFLVKAIESASHINRVNICQETHLTSRRPCCSLLLSPASKDPLKHYLKSSVSPLAGIHASLKISKEPIQLGVQDRGATQLTLHSFERPQQKTIFCRMHFQRGQHEGGELSRLVPQVLKGSNLDDRLPHKQTDKEHFQVCKIGD